MKPKEKIKRLSNNVPYYLEIGLFWSRFLEILWMDSTPDDTAATSSSSKKMTLQAEGNLGKILGYR